MLKYRIEHHINGRDETVHLGHVGAAAARSRARRLSEKDGDLGPGLGHSVYLMAADADGVDQEMYCYFAGSLAEKDLVKDWDK
jgi:hypothetical protein